MSTHYSQSTQFQHEQYHNISNSSSPFIRQGFGRISRTSGKFNSLKGLALLPDYNTMQKDEGHHLAGDDMEGNQMFSYTSHTKENQSSYKTCKSVGNGNSEYKRKEKYNQDNPTTSRSKVENITVLLLNCIFRLQNLDFI